jgi:hypothetical protein
MGEHGHPEAPTNEVHPLHFFLLITGGLTVGFGIVNLIGSFGWTGGDINSDLSQTGFTGLDQIGWLPGADTSVPLVILGALLLVFANATAWKQTGGY